MNTIFVKFNEKIQPEPNTGCWIWIGGSTPDGYGVFRFLGKTERAHRVSYAIFNNCVIPARNEFICHKCDNPYCVNPSHLFIGSAKDNMQDAMLKNRAVFWHRNKTHCIRGHEFTTENTRIKKNTNFRHCRMCDRISWDKFKKKWNHINDRINYKTLRGGVKPLVL